MDYATLKAEIETDPLIRGYSGMSDAEVAADLNTVYRDGPPRTTLDAAELFEAIVPAEMQALSDALRVRVDRILSLGTGIRVGPGSNGRAELVAAFGVDSDTITAMAALLPTLVSRATELGLGTVKAGHVEKARA